MRSVYLAFFLIAMLLAGCGASKPAPPPAPAELQGIVPLERIAAGEVDGQSVTIVAVYYQRAGNHLLVPALSFADRGGPVPLLDKPEHALRLSSVPVGDFTEVDGITYGIVRITGRVTVENGERTLDPETVKVVQPLEMQPDAVGSGFEGQVLSVEGVLLSSPDSMLMTGSVGPGGVPASGSKEVKVLMRVPDDALLSRLEQTAAGEVRYGSVRAVGLWSGGALQLFWAQQP